MRYLSLLALLAATPALLGQQPAFQEEQFHGRRAFVLENGLMRVSTLPGGGFIGEIRLLSPDPRKSVNPLRVPHYQTIDPFRYEAATHGELYGTGIQRRLMSGYMGHFLCFPQYGPTSAAELNFDLGQHGEALAVEWKRQKVESGPQGVTLRYSAELPKNQYRIERAITLAPGETVGYVEESIENLTPYDRPVNWVQHITFGPPFLAPGRTYADAPVTRVLLADGTKLHEGDWPEITDPQGLRVNQRRFIETPNSGRYTAWLLDRSRPKVWFTLYNPDYPVLIGYIFPAESNPWIGDWQENQRVTAIPWNGKAIARGIDIGTTPFAEGLRRSVDRGSVLGVPTFRWIEARERQTQRYLFFLAEIPSGYKGTADVKVEGGKIVIVEQQSERTIAINSSREW
ncbi:MAG: hypothetical protein ACK5AZ_19440 [Bryobacteraceae bacterium]